MKLTFLLCDLCLKDDQKIIATYCCNDCNHNLCDIHLKLHNKKKKVDDHILISLQQSTIKSTSSSKNHIDHHYCKDHSDQIMEMYCKDCNIIICVKCALFKHKLHNYIELTDIVNVEKENIKNLITITNSKKEIILQRNKNLNFTITKFNEQIEKIQKEIIQHFEDLQNELNEKKHKLLLELNKIEKDKLQSLQNENETLKEYCNNINELLQSNNSNLNNIDILQYKIKLENELNNLKKKLNTLNLNNLNNIHIYDLNIEIDKNILNLITNLGNIENKEIKNDILLFNLNNNVTDIKVQHPLQISLQNTLQNTLQNNILNTNSITNNKNPSSNVFNLITFKLITEFKKNIPIRFEDIIYNNNLICIADYNNCKIIILDNLFNYKNEIKLSSNPISLAITNYHLYIGCKNNNIYKYNLNTLKIINTIKSNKFYTLDYINGMTCDKYDYLYICNGGAFKEIIILNSDNVYMEKIKININFCPKRIIVNNKNQIVITFYDKVQIYDKFGNFILSVKFDNLQVNLNGIICDCNDNYIICDYNNKLLLLDSNLKLKEEHKNNLYKPIGIAFNREINQIYIVEHGGHYVKVFY